jgi:hypothetical protein
MRRAGARFTDPKLYEGYDWGAKQKIVDEIRDQYFAPWKLEIDGYILKLIDELDLNSHLVHEAIESIKTKAHLSFLHAVAVGWIKPYDEAIDGDTSNCVNTDQQVSSYVHGKKPVYADAKRQAQLKMKYPWAQQFIPDPVNRIKTNVIISCVVCGGSRTVHLSDLFITKKCLKCRKSKRQ